MGHRLKKGCDLKSSIQDFPTIEQPKQTQAADRTQEPVSPVPPLQNVPLAARGRRKIKRREPFDIYEDQDEALRTLSREDRLRGGAGSMSAMVREALDDYIAKIRA
jgi:hypothetical protein